MEIVLEAAQERARRALQGATDDPERSPKRNHGHPPKHLPRIERVIKPGSILYPNGYGVLSRWVVGWSMKADRDASQVTDAPMMADWTNGRKVHIMNLGQTWPLSAFRRNLP